jgi:hypothetical protein
MTLQRKPVARVVEDVKLTFAEANARRAAEGLPALRVPGRDAVRGFIKRLDGFAVLVARRGVEQAMRRMRPVKGGVEVTRPLKRVEMDEQNIDLIAILAQSGLLPLFSEDAATPAEQARVQAIPDGILPVSVRREGLLNDARETGHARLDYGAVRVPTLALSLENDLFGSARGADAGRDGAGGGAGDPAGCRISGRH